MDRDQLHVGDVLVLRDSNERRTPNGKDEAWYPPLVPIVKIGRTRVTVVGPYGGRELSALIADGRITGWSWLQTRAEYDASVARVDMNRRLSACGLQQIPGRKITDAQLAAILAILEAGA